MAGKIITIDGIEYRFLPDRCEIYPVVSTDVIVQRWVDECVDLSLESGDGMQTKEYYGSYRGWGGTLTQGELYQVLKRLGHEVGGALRVLGKDGKWKSKRMWRWASLKV